MAGDVVDVIGDMNADGFYHVQFENRQGLVPAHFLEEMNIKNATIKRRLRNQVCNVTPALLKITKSFFSASHIVP